MDVSIGAVILSCVVKGPHADLVFVDSVSGSENWGLWLHSDIDVAKDFRCDDRVRFRGRWIQMPANPGGMFISPLARLNHCQ